MRYFLIFLYCFPLVVFSQEKALSGSRTDSVTVKNKIRFLDPGWKKHNHIVDFTWTLGVFNFDSSDGALGYRYLYNTDWRWNIKFGVRVGVWFRKSRQDLPEIQHRNFFNYSVLGIVRLPIWQIFSFELSPGVRSDFFWPQSKNTIDQKGFHSGQILFKQKIGLNIIFASHFCFDFGLYLDYDKTSNLWYKSSYFSIGYKF